ncbi:MAG: response regulator [Magnetococcales bacterium]|nr:response regulator [Magnetococcales bacterium]
MRALLSGMLRHVGHTVVESDNGQGGLEQMNAYPAELVITDIFMPEMDGLEFLITLLEKHPDSKVIAISGGYKAVNACLSLQMAKALGATDIIAKPFHTAAVIRQVAYALQSKTIAYRRRAER